MDDAAGHALASTRCWRAVAGRRGLRPRTPRRTILITNGGVHSGSHALEGDMAAVRATWLRIQTVIRSMDARVALHA
jgi:hypothetical protein